VRILTRPATRATTIFVLALMLEGCTVPTVRQAEMLKPMALPVKAFSNVIDISTVRVRLPFAERGMRLQYGWLCESGDEVALPNDSLPLTRRDIEEAFRRALAPLNYKFPTPPDSVFQTARAEGAQLLLGATVIKREASLRFQSSGSRSLAF
jgi:hypothetical protein